MPSRAWAKRYVARPWPGCPSSVRYIATLQYG